MLSENKKQMYDDLAKGRKIQREATALLEDQWLKNFIRFYDEIDDANMRNLTEDFYWDMITEKDLRRRNVPLNLINRLGSATNTEAIEALFASLKYFITAIEIDLSVMKREVQEHNSSEVKAKLRQCERALEVAKELKEELVYRLMNDAQNKQREVRDNIALARQARIDNRMDRTHGLTHIHASQHPLALHAKKTTPKRKTTGIRNLENSVRKMF